MKLNKNVLSDRALKIISIIFAIGLWVYVSQVESPDITRTIKNVPVVFSQKNTLEKKGLVLTDNNEHSIDVKIKGRRQYVYEVNLENLTIIADVSDLNHTGSHVLTPEIVLPYGNLEIVSKNPASISVTVDSLVTREFPATVEPVGSPKSDYVCGKTTISKDTVVVKGPKGLVESIEKIIAPIDVSGKSADVASISELKIYSSSGNEIKSPYITLSESSLETQCEILKSKTVDIVPVFSGSVNVALSYNADSNNIKSVKIAGSAEVIDSIDEILTKPISSKDIDDDGKTTVKLNLPAGVLSLDGDSFTFRFSLKTE